MPCNTSSPQVPSGLWTVLGQALWWTRWGGSRRFMETSLHPVSCCWTTPRTPAGSSTSDLDHTVPSPLLVDSRLLEAPLVQTQPLSLRSQAWRRSDQGPGLIRDRTNLLLSRGCLSNFAIWVAFSTTDIQVASVWWNGLLTNIWIFF